jgi:hypothetical protein
VVTERAPGSDIDWQLQDLSRLLNADVFYRFDAALAGVGAGAATLGVVHVHSHERGLFDLLLTHNAENELGFRIRPDRFVSLRPDDVLAMPGEEIRLAADGGHGTRVAGARLAREVNRPVWVAPGGAAISRTENDWVIAIDGQTQAPVPWVQLTPRPVLTESPPWYDTSAGLFEAREGFAVLEFRSERTGQVQGIMVAGQSLYNRSRTEDPVLTPEPGESYFVGAAVDLNGPAFWLPGFNGERTRYPLRDLPGLLRDHGWEAGQDIVIGADFSAAEGAAHDQYWADVTADLAEIARSEGVSVYFPGRGSAAAIRYGGELVVTGPADPRWDRRDLPDRPARLIQAVTGGLRSRSQNAVVSLRMSGLVVTEDRVLRAGVASPTEEMMRARARAYDDSTRGGVATMFVVDVPLTDDGHIGLVRQDDGAGEPGWPVTEASAAEVGELIRGGGHHQTQAVQFLAAPATQEQHDIFARQAEEVAGVLDRDVLIVGQPGATVLYRHDLRAFAAVRVGQNGETEPVLWRLVRPAAASRRSGVPAYFGTNEHGVAVPTRDSGRFETFGNLVSFGPESFVDSYRDQYWSYSDRGGSELAVIVVPTRGGKPRVQPQHAAAVIANLRVENRPARLNSRPMRLLFRSFDQVASGRGLEAWAQVFAQAMETAVYVAEGTWYSDISSDFGARRWQLVTPGTADGPATSMPRYVRNPVSGLLVREYVAANPLPAPADGADQARGGPPPGELVVERTGRLIELPGQAGGMPAAGPRSEDIPDGQVVVVAHSRDGRTVMGLLQPEGAKGGEPVPVPPAWMAEIIRRTPGYTPDSVVIFLVPALGRRSVLFSEPEQYAQQVANLLGARVEAVTTESPRGDLLEGRAVFEPMRLVLDEDSEAGATRLVSLPPHLRETLQRSAAPPDSPVVEVFVETFEDGSLGLYYYGPDRRDQREAYPVSPWFIAQTLEPVLNRRPFVIRPIGAPGIQVSQARLLGTIAEVRALFEEWAGRPAAASQLRTRSLVSQLRLPMVSAMATEARAAILDAGDAVASAYVSLVEGALLPDGWVADIQLPAGLWIRPTWPAEHVAGARTELAELPPPEGGGLIVVGWPGRAVAPAARLAVRQALELVAEPERTALRVVAIGTAPSEHHFDDLVAAEERIVAEAPPYFDPPVFAEEEDAATLEQQWAQYAAQWGDVLDALAGDEPPPNLDKRPERFPRDRAEAFGLYQEARDERDYVTARLAELAAHASDSSSPDRQLLRERQQAAVIALGQAGRWLAEWGISDPDAAVSAAEEFSRKRASGLPGGTRERREADGEGSGSAGTRLDGGFVSVAGSVRAELEAWLQDRVRVPGVFDLALTEAGNALSPFGTGDLLEAAQLARRLPGWGAADGDVIRLVAPGGTRFAGMMAELAQLTGRPVLRTPMSARIARVRVAWQGRPGADVAPSGLRGQLVPWLVSWPRESWEYQQGRGMVAAGLPFSDAFAAGLRAGPDGLIMLYNRDGGAFAVRQPEADHLRALGWDGRQGIVLVTERWPGAVIDARLRELSTSLAVPLSYRLPSGFAGPGAGALLGRLRLRRPEPGLFDLLGAVVRADDLPELPGGQPEVRLVMDDGERVEADAAELARELNRPVWVTPAGASVRVRPDGRLIAVDRQTRAPVAWVQIMPAPVSADAPPWYDTDSGLFRPRRGDAVVELRHESAGEVAGVVLVGHRQYNAARIAAPLPRSHPAGLYVVSVAIDRQRGEFLWHDFGGRLAGRPLRDLPRLLEAHGWTRGRPIMIVTDFSDLADEGDEAVNRGWDAITGAFDQIAHAEGVSVFFPGRGSGARNQYGDNDFAVTGGTHPRWERSDPPGAPDRFFQDPAGRLRERSGTGVISLSLTGTSTEGQVRLRAGVASPTPAMVRDRAEAYDDERSADRLGVFVVDFPASRSGHIGLVSASDRSSDPGWRPAPARASEVAEMIRAGGYQQGRQVLQFLAAPRTQEGYETFVREAQDVADELGQGVYVVGAADATIGYLHDRHMFASWDPRGNGQPVPWRWLAPAGPAGQERAPLFETDADGALVGAVSSTRDRWLRSFGNLVTFEPQRIIDGYTDEATGAEVPGERDLYERYASAGGRLPILVAETRAGRPLDSAGAELPVTAAANAVRDLAALQREVLRANGWTQEHLGDSIEPVRLLLRQQGGAESRARLGRWAQALAEQLGVPVYLAERGAFSAHFSDFTADRWRRFDPGEQNRAGSAPVQVTDAVTGLLGPEDLAANPLRGEGASGTPAASPDIVTESIRGGLVLPGRDGIAWSGERPDEGFVVVAYGGPGRLVLGLPRRSGAAEKAEMVPLPPAWLAERIRAAPGYAPGTPVIFLVPGLGAPWPEAPVREHYLQQVADLLQAPVEAIVSVNASRRLAEPRAVFRPRQPEIATRVDEAGVIRVRSLSPRWQFADGASAQPGSPEAQVLLEAFEDGSLGLYYSGDGQGQGRTYPASPPLIAAALAAELAGWPFRIRPVSAPDVRISEVRLAATIAAVQAHAAAEAPPYHDFSLAEPTPSGFHLRARGAGGVQDGPLDRVAARAFPPVRNAVVVHVHTDPASGRFAVGGRLLTAAQFQAEVVPLLGLTEGQLLVLVAGRLGAAGRPGELTAAGALAYFSRRPVLASSGDVFTTQAGAVEVRAAGVNAQGQPVLAPAPAGWLLYRPGQVAPAVFGPNLAGVVGDPALAAELPPEAQAPVIEQPQQPESPPADEVRWSGRGGQDLQPPQRGVRWNGDYPDDRFPRR